MTDKKAKEGTFENAVGYKPRLHKLNPAQFKEQVESLSDTELKRLIEEVQAEKQRRIEESKKVIELFKEEGK